MSFISYAQNYEDVMLWRALKHVEKGFYIDVGAAWPDKDSVTKHFYDQGWRGINVEPNPIFFQQYKEVRPDDINLQVAVSDVAGEVEIYLVSDTGLSSLSRGIVEEHERSGFIYRSVQVPALTLQEICEEHVRGSDVHFLKIDVEGWEEQVLKSNDWNRCRPWVVVVEATLPMTNVESYSASEPILLEAGYEFVYGDGLNRYYVSPEHLELVPSFKYPPNVFDDFVSSREALLDSKFQESEQRAQESEKKRRHIEQKLQRLEKEQRGMEKRAQHMQADLSRLQSKADQAAQMLQDIRVSTSWRITAPFRWVSHQTRLLRQLGMRARFKAFLRLLAIRVYKWVEARPSLKRGASRIFRYCGLLPYLKSIRNRMARLQAYSEVGLTPCSQSVYKALRAACQRKAGYR